MTHVQGLHIILFTVLITYILIIYIVKINKYIKYTSTLLVINDETSTVPNLVHQNHAHFDRPN